MSKTLLFQTRASTIKPTTTTISWLFSIHSALAGPMRPLSLNPSAETTGRGERMPQDASAPGKIRESLWESLQGSHHDIDALKTKVRNDDDLAGDLGMDSLD